LRYFEGMAEGWKSFWAVDSLLWVAGIAYVTGKIVSGPVELWWAVVSYGMCFAAAGLLALCYWSLRETAKEKARGDR
jgi:hypothetical protein